MTFVSELEPRSLWGHFDRILEIPRGSKEEDRIRAYVLEVAARNGLEHRGDGVGNVVVLKPGSAGHENAPVTVLQSHLDMVNEKNSDVEHDFSRDPLRPERDGEYLTAKGTTLGSDNGIGVAAMLAVMDADDLTHGPLELLFTIDEETGLTGASALDGAILEGRRLINLDTEEEGAIYVGCAGGGGSDIALPVTRVAPAGDARGLRLALRGLKGGHSGGDIHLQRGNAIRLLARLVEAGGRGATLHLGGMEGGDKHNAIPREASAVVVLPADGVEGFRSRVQDELGRIQDAFRPTEPNLTLDLSEVEVPSRVMDPNSTWRVVHLVHALPHGVLAMSHAIPDLVETSSNIARVRTGTDGVTVHCSTRSSVAGELEATRARIRAMAHLAGATVEQDAPYPGWKPDLDSELLSAVKEVYADALGREPALRAIHAGLETGIIGEKVPGMDMVSIGPQIEFPHSPDERVRIPSVADFWGMLTSVLERLA